MPHCTKVAGVQVSECARRLREDRTRSLGGFRRQEQGREMKRKKFDTQIQDADGTVASFRVDKSHFRVGEAIDSHLRVLLVEHVRL